MYYQHNPEQIESYINEQITKPTLGNEKKNTNKIESEISKVNNNMINFLMIFLEEKLNI